MRGIRKTWAAAVSAALLSAAGYASAGAAELKPGDVINQANLKQALESTFEGMPVKDLVHPRLAWQIEKYGLTMKLGPSQSMPAPYRLRELTKRYKDQATIDPQTLVLSNYRGGQAFATLDPADPMLGAKVVWNHLLGRPEGNQPSGLDTLLLIDGFSGVDRVFSMQFTRYYGMNRFTEFYPNDLPVDPPVYYKELLFFLAPHDIKGLGTFALRHNSPQYEDVWAYVKAVRRIRRLSGGAWLDPVGGTDFLRDDIRFNAYPSWYKGFKVLAKTKMLMMNQNWPEGIEQGKWDRAMARGFDKDQVNPIQRFHRHDLSNAPYWFPVEPTWIPRDVYIVDALTPPEHPYSKKIAVFDAENWNFYASETFDRKGEFWKWQMQGFAPFLGGDDFVGPDGKYEVYVSEMHDNIYDYQRMHGTIYASSADRWLNSNLRDDDVSLTALEAQAR